jgi:hypothetical protein
MSLSANEGRVLGTDDEGLCDGPEDVLEEAAGLSSSSSSSSSITNWVPVDSETLVLSSCTISRFQKTSSSNLLQSGSVSKTTGRIRCNSRKQFRTSFVALRSDEPVLLLINEVANDVTDVVDVVGNVWSETRLKRRFMMTRRSVAMFSGAS